MDLNKNIEDFDLIFIDLETTGLDAVTGDSICEIGAFKVRKREIIDKFYSLINPKKNIPKEAYSVHKISDEELKGAPYFEEVAAKLLSFLQGSILCAYNIGFDMGFINQHLSNMNCQSLNNPAIDILSMARDILNLPRYNLEATANFFNIDCQGKLHRALGDAIIAYDIFKRLVDIFKEKKIGRLVDFLSLYGLDNEIFTGYQNKKIDSLNPAIENKQPVKIRYFSSAKMVKDESVMPLRLLQEGRYFYLLYQSYKQNSSRIRLNRILKIETFSD